MRIGLDCVFIINGQLLIETKLVILINSIFENKFGNIQKHHEIGGKIRYK